MFTFLTGDVIFIKLSLKTEVNPTCLTLRNNRLYHFLGILS